MKLTENRFNPYGLRARLGLHLAVSGLICILVFFIINTGCNLLFENYYKKSDFENRHMQNQITSLQEFIDENNISSEDLSKINKWEKKQPVILLEIFEDDRCIYSSLYDAPVSSMVLDEDIKSPVSIELSDKTVSAVLFSDFTYKFNIIGTAISIVASLLLFILLFLRNSSKLIHYICRLNDEVQILEGGNLEYHVSEEGNDEITDLARSMNRMRVTLQNQMETEQQLHKANRQLITEMSHDLRTPLTGIMLYLEILRSRKYESEEQLQDYLEKIDAKAHHMKLLSDYLFEYSMQDVIEKQSEPHSMEQAFGQALNTMKDDIEARGFTVTAEIEWEKCFVQVNSEYLNRILENITSNIEKYGEPAADIRIDTIHSDKYCGFLVMNTLSEESQAVESNGVGIESIRSMMKQMNGTCSIEQSDTTFEITLLFPKQ